MPEPDALDAVALIARGYFPRELPPPFTTAQFAQFVGTVDADGDAAPRLTECIRHNLARAGGQRRAQKIPNPENFLELALLLEEVWPELEEHFGLADLSISRPTVTSAGRAIAPQYRLGEAPRFRAQHWATGRFVLKSDITQFYHSLYTHGIPWALHGKSVAKAQKGNKGLLGNRLDRSIRAGSDGQTVGIPVGPDTSLVAAEVVLTAVDKELRDRLPDLRGFRYLDDYDLVFTTRAAAERALVVLEAVLADYELMVNPRKTTILELPEPLRDEWPYELRAFRVRTQSARVTVNDLITLLSTAAAVAKHRPGALKYALLRLRGLEIHAGAWPTFQHIVWSAVSSEPTTLSTALDLLQSMSSAIDQSVDTDLAKEALEGVIATHAPLRNTSEVVWALWASTELAVELSEIAAMDISDIEDDFVALMALHAESYGFLPEGSLDVSKWSVAISDSTALLGPHWLLAYEASEHGWLTEAVDAVHADPFFGQLSEHEVRFFDPDIDFDPFSGAGPLPGGVLTDVYG